MKEIRSSQFNGLSYNFVAHDIESIQEQPGLYGLSGIAESSKDAANSTWWTFHDEAIVRDRHWHFKANEIILDIGAAFGSYAITAAIQGARVYALEPGECCRAILSQNIEVNPNISERITVVPFGVHSSDGFFDPVSGELRTELIGEKCLVVKTIDTIVQDLNIERLDLMKFDIEGVEFLALQGAKNTLEKFKPRLLIEEHEFKVPGIGKSCQEFLEPLGYTCERHPYGPGAINHAFYIPV
jgi:FkbM family methyltransferase